MTGILIKYGLQYLMSYALPGGTGLPPHWYFQSSYLGAVMKMSVNNSPLRWPIHEGEKDGVGLWSWLKIKHESAAKSDPLRRFYGEKISLLKLKSGGSLGNYIEQFQGLAILWRKIDTNVQL